ncbi:hypothetical protein ALI144C_37065 [Actinosynnema sp. ALI-1.44]|nr:hypothetical protein ALI144C_37065 [Actinosynnema sp. ALI-1.44]
MIGYLPEPRVVPGVRGDQNPPGAAKQKCAADGAHMLDSMIPQDRRPRLATMIASTALAQVPPS